MVMQGFVQSVSTRPGGDYPLAPAAAGDMVIVFGDASDFDTDGGYVQIGDATVEYVTVDLDEDVMTLAEPLPLAVDDETFIATVPHIEYTTAVVAFNDDVAEAVEVPHHLKPLLEEGPREPGEGEAVTIDEPAPGLFRVVDVLGVRPAFGGEYVDNLEDALLENRQRLGDLLAENEAAITDAQGELSSTLQRLEETFDDNEGSSEATFVDNGDGTVTVTAAEGTAEDNGDGTVGLRFTGPVDNGNGTVRLGAFPGWTLDSGKLTARSGAINDLVAQTFAAKLANIIEANIGNLTVTGDTHLQSVVAQAIAGDTASFMELTVDQILAGTLQAQWIIADGAIVAGDPEGARVEFREDGLSLYVVGPNGQPYELVAIRNGHVSIGVMGEDGTLLGGVSRDGAVTGSSGSFSHGLDVRGVPVVGTRAGEDWGWLDRMPRGVIALNRREKTLSANTEVERRYLYVTATLHPGRLYRVSAWMRMQLNAQGALTYLRIRHSEGSGRVPIDANLLGTELGAATSPTTGNRRVTPMVEAFYSVGTTQVHSFVSTFVGFYGATPSVETGYIYVEDVGPIVADTGSIDDEATGTVLYTTTWVASAARRYNKDGALVSDNGKIDQWYWRGTPTDFQSAAILFGGGAVESDNSSEVGKTIQSALGGGATVRSAMVTVRNKVFYDGRRGVVGFGNLGATSLPSSLLVDSTEQQTATSGELITRELPTSFFQGGTNTGVTFGDKDGILPGSTTGLSSGAFHGVADSDPPLLTITYSR